MSLGFFEIFAILVVVVLLFGGRGRISSIMGDMGKGMRSFKEGLKGEKGGEGDKKLPPENTPKND